MYPFYTGVFTGMKSVLIFVGLCISSITWSQADLSGKISGTGGSKVPDAVIFFPELNRSARVDSTGDFMFHDLPVGQFILQITASGYETNISTTDLQAGANFLVVELTPTSRLVGEVVVYGHQNAAPKQTANEIMPLSTENMRLNGALSISDGLSRLPGVTQMSTGSGISKPVIRGLYGNRIQTVVLGLRFDNQQWQDEHGLGLSDIGVDRVEIIKGPSSLLYGSEAMGGVLNIIEEKPVASGVKQVDFSTRFFSNTLGYTSDVGYKTAKDNLNWRIRAGIESHADYLDGNNFRVLNSRFGGYYAKAGFGFKKNNWISNNNYLFSLSSFGFLMDSVNLFDPPDARMSRSFDRPHHTVVLNILSSQNIFFLPESKLKVNVGFHSNNRQEQEGGNKISLDMLLNTYIANALWSKKFSRISELSIGTQDFFQTNLNQGSRTIIPDANQFESSLFGYYKHTLEHLVLEGGLRLDVRNIQTFKTGLINIADPLNPGNAVTPFNRWYNSVNGSLGLSLFDDKHWNLKINTSSGYRPGNLAELSSNGLHEGTIRYEIGDINLKIEQNLCADVLVAYDNKHFTLSASAYYNHFFNYIYLQPTSLEYIGFQIFQYVQKDADLKGAEFTASVHPAGLKWLSMNVAYSYIDGQTSDHEYLPFIPAPKLNSDLRFAWSSLGKISQLFITPGVTYVFEQNRPNQFETSTPEYYLLNLSGGIKVAWAKRTLLFSVSGNNLTSLAYFDHLSRFKYFGVYNIGRNISLNFKMTFNN